MAPPTSSASVLPTRLPQGDLMGGANTPPRKAVGTSGKSRASIGGKHPVGAVKVPTPKRFGKKNKKPRLSLPEALRGIKGPVIARLAYRGGAKRFGTEESDDVNIPRGNVADKARNHIAHYLQKIIFTGLTYTGCDKRATMSVQDVINASKELGHKLVGVTGGKPPKHKKSVLRKKPVAPKKKK